MSAAADVLSLELAVAVEIGMDATEGFTVSVLNNTLAWDRPADTSVVGILVFRTRGATIASDDDAAPVELPPTESEYDLRDDLVCQDANGEAFSFAVATVDAAGRRSTLEKLENVLLDFTAPAPVTNLRLVARD